MRRNLASSFLSSYIANKQEFKFPLKCKNQAQQEKNKTLL